MKYIKIYITAVFFLIIIAISNINYATDTEDGIDYFLD